MDWLNDFNQRLVCPFDRTLLEFDEGFYTSKGVPYPDGEIRCSKGHCFMIEHGIPRFVPRSNYASAFGIQWKRYQKTQLDSYTGYPYSLKRLEGNLGMPIEQLAGKKVLEVGSGAGRFTEHLINKCNLLVSFDLSDAVEANLKNCSSLGSLFLCQADISKSPFPYHYFDVVICMGVIQNTPSPEQTISSLAKHVKPGGMLVIDHFTYKKGWVTALCRVLSLQFPLREILKRLSPALGLKATIAITALFYPIRKHTSKIHWLDRFASRIFPCACHDNAYPLLSPEVVYEWNELDTHDRMTPYFVHFRSPKQIQDSLEKNGLHVTYCDYGGNGVEARAFFRN